MQRYASQNPVRAASADLKAAMIALCFMLRCDIHTFLAIYQSSMCRLSPSCAQAALLVGYAMVYIFMQTFAIPGTVSLSLLSGALFGVARGLILVAGSSLHSIIPHKQLILTGKRSPEVLSPHVLWLHPEIRSCTVCLPHEDCEQL